MKRRFFLCILITAILAGCQVDANNNPETPINQSQSLVYAVDVEDDGIGIREIPCPVGLVNGLPLNDEFGPGTRAITRCLDNRSIRVVYQINSTCRNDACTKPYALGNIKNAYNDYVVTHGLRPDMDFEIVAVVYSAGYKLVVDNNALEPFAEENPFQSTVEELLGLDIDIYFCQNTARSKGVMTANLIPGIKYVTSGVTALADYQLNGYAIIQP